MLHIFISFQFILINVEQSAPDPDKTAWSGLRHSGLSLNTEKPFISSYSTFYALCFIFSVFCVFHCYSTL